MGCYGGVGEIVLLPPSFNRMFASSNVRNSKAERTHFTFQTFFQSDICKKRGYDQHRRMHRKDLLGIDR